MIWSKKEAKVLAQFGYGINMWSCLFDKLPWTVFQARLLSSNYEPSLPDMPAKEYPKDRIWFKHQTRLHIMIGKIDQYFPKKITYLASVFGFFVIGTVLASIGKDLLASLGSSTFSKVVEWSEVKCGAGNFFLLNIKTTALKVLSSSRSIVNRMFIKIWSNLEVLKHSRR